MGHLNPSRPMKREDTCHPGVRNLRYSRGPKLSYHQPKEKAPQPCPSRDAHSQVAGHRQMDKFVPETLAPSVIWPPKEDPSPGKLLIVQHYLSTVYKIHIISWRWTSTGLGDSQREYLDRRRPRSQNRLQGLVPGLLITRTLPF